MNEAVIKACKAYVNQGDLAGLMTYYGQVRDHDFGYNLNWEYIYHRIYLHACLKKKQDIADWLTSIFSSFDIVSQAGLRQIFPYGRYLLAKG
jgi:hypothetical protein